MCVDLPLDKKAGKSGLGHRASGPLGRRGPWTAGRWAAGLLLAKPVTLDINSSEPKIVNCSEPKQESKCMHNKRMGSTPFIDNINSC